MRTGMVSVRQASPEIGALDAQIRHHMRRRTGPVGRFLCEWLRLDEVIAAFLNARGNEGETYLHYTIATGDHEMATGILEMCAKFIDTIARTQIIEFLATADTHGNTAWHYLSARLAGLPQDTGASAPAEEWGNIVVALAKLNAGVRRVNARGETALAGFFLPRAHWPTVNALIGAQALTLEILEFSLDALAGGDAGARSRLVADVLIADVGENQARLCQSILGETEDGFATRELRTSAVAALFTWAAGKRGDTVFLKMVEADVPDIVEQLLTLLQAFAVDESAPLMAFDLTAAKVQQQIVMYQLVSTVNRDLHGPLAKAVLSNRPAIVERLSRVFRNDDLQLAQRGLPGTKRELVMLDEASAAPSNPWLSLLLQQDSMGNTPLHAAVLWGRVHCFSRLIAGLSMVDVNMLLRGVPNRFNLTVMDLSLPAAAEAKLGIEVQARRVNAEAAKAILALIERSNPFTRDLLADILRRATDGARKAINATAARPGFDVSRLPSVQYLKQTGVDVYAAGQG